jgi:predicted anti-sigma-YlaC factor YlaD
VKSSARTWFRTLDRECQTARESISAELDGEISEIEAAAARRHRAECADCDRFAESVARTAQAVRAAPQLVPSRRLVPAPSRVAARSVALAGFAAALVAAAFLGGGLASRLSHGPAHRDPTVIVADNESPLALQQMQIRHILHEQAPARQPRHQRLG